MSGRVDDIFLRLPASVAGCLRIIVFHPRNGVHMPTQAKESAKFVFEGTVKKTNAANLKAIADTAHSAVVTVDKVVRAPQPLAGFGGHDVTVQLAPGERIKKGQRALFHTNTWMFGENLAVQSLGHDSLRGPSAVAAVAALPDPARAAAHQEISERAATAPVVITGKVVAVGLPGAGPTAAAQPAAAAAVQPAAGQAAPRISEHDPFWREAVIEVNAVHKGTVKKNKVLLRFPSSSDVRWYRAPKFQVGQQGIFSLRRDDVSGHQALGAMAVSFAPEAAYTALDSADFQPLDHEAEAAIAVSAAKK
jgi:hypothetical protein